jgi:ankyrin repeat protein
MEVPKRIKPNATDNKGQTPLALAVEKGHRQVVILLLKALKRCGVSAEDIQKRDVWGRAPWEFAPGKSLGKIEELLITSYQDFEQYLEF